MLQKFGEHYRLAPFYIKTIPTILRYFTVSMARSAWHRVKGLLRYTKINPDNSANPY